MVAGGKKNNCPFFLSLSLSLSLSKSGYNIGESLFRHLNGNNLSKKKMLLLTYC
jgi:hypothetical protein